MRTAVDLDPAALAAGDHAAGAPVKAALFLLLFFAALMILLALRAPDARTAAAIEAVVDPFAQVM